MASHPIYQFYAVLDDYKPKIWRRFQVSNNILIARFCYIIQVLFEMKGSHRMMLEVPKGANFTEYFKKTYPDISLRATIPFGAMKFGMKIFNHLTTYKGMYRLPTLLKKN